MGGTGWANCNPWSWARSTGCWTRAAHRIKADPDDIYRATVAGNSTMIHLFLGMPAGEHPAFPLHHRR